MHRKQPQQAPLLNIYKIIKYIFTIIQISKKAIPLLKNQPEFMEKSSRNWKKAKKSV